MADWLKDTIFKSKEMKGLYPHEKAGNDGEYVKDSYEHHWGKKIEGLKARMERGESVAHMMAVLRTSPHLITAYNRVGGHIAKQKLSGFTETHDGKSMSRLGMTEGRYVVMPNFDPLVNIKRMTNDFRNIVELGAGPGWNLFDIGIYLGKHKLTKRFLFGLEYSDAGVEIINMLGEHEKMPIKGYQFDYTKPDISMIPDNGPTLFYSHLSIEQVEDISRDLYNQLAKRKHPTKLIHVEPIGWQRYPDIVAARMKNDDDFFKALITNRLTDLDAPHAGVMNAAINSWRVKYNRNTMSHIQHFEKAGKLRIDYAHYDFTHNNNVNAANPCSYIEMTFNPDQKSPVKAVKAAAPKTTKKPASKRTKTKTSGKTKTTRAKKFNIIKSSTKKKT